MKKIVCCIFSISVLITSLFSEIRYIEIDSIKNVPVIEIKLEEDFEAIINEYGIKIGYLQKNSSESTLFVIADSVYFSFPLKGVYTMLFPETPKPRAMERLMTSIPNFRPQGSGVVVMHRFELLPEPCPEGYSAYYC